MRRIPDLFVRDREDRRFVTDQVTPGTEWVLAGEGVARRQYDGVCVLLDPSLEPETPPAVNPESPVADWWVRRKLRPTDVEPPGWVPLETDRDGRVTGWEPAAQSQWVQLLAQAVMETQDPQPGTYELIGPRINRNPDKADRHRIVRHDDAETLDAPRTYEGLRRWLPRQPLIEGVVWQHPDGRMAKLKRRDLRLS